MQSRSIQKAKNLPISLSLLLCLSVLPAINRAEVLKLPQATNIAPPAYSVTLPGRGMSMTEVIAQFGEPQEKQPEVGEPPITRWVYPGYLVIFEYQYVIHSLSTNKPMGLMKPKPDSNESTDGNTQGYDKPESQAPSEQPMPEPEASTGG